MQGFQNLVNVRSLLWRASGRIQIGENTHKGTLAYKMKDRCGFLAWYLALLTVCPQPIFHNFWRWNLCQSHAFVPAISFPWNDFSFLLCSASHPPGKFRFYLHVAFLTACLDSLGLFTPMAPMTSWKYSLFTYRRVCFPLLIGFCITSYLRFFLLR